MGRKAVVLGHVRVDSPSKILNIEGDLELKTGLAGSGSLLIESFKNSGTVTIGCMDQGYSGTFILADSAEDGAVLDVEFSEAFPQAGLTFRSNNSARMPVLLLKNDLKFASVAMPSATGGIIDLKPGTYDAAALKSAGVSEQAFSDLGGALTVGQ